jgi:putative endonuclease
MMRDRKGTHNKTGAVGEMVARNWLINKGFSIVADNYQKKWGEIDLIAKQGKVIHFIEVKAVSYDSKADLERYSGDDSWRPEELVHPKKLLKIQRTIESWLIENNYEGEWQIDIAAVRLVPSVKYATIDWIDNVILG